MFTEKEMRDLEECVRIAKDFKPELLGRLEIKPDDLIAKLAGLIHEACSHRKNLN